MGMAWAIPGVHHYWAVKARHPLASVAQRKESLRMQNRLTKIRGIITFSSTKFMLGYYPQYYRLSEVKTS
jgi:hypothetical protein